jgi:hypothetical protein
MPPRLGEILLRDRACTPEAVVGGLQNQVIFGGRLGTNLLELGAVQEDALARALGIQHGVPSLFGDLQVDPRAVVLVRAEVADRYDVVPYLLAGRKLAVLAVDPSNLQMLDEVAFVTGRRIHPIVAPEARIWALLRKVYGIERQLRGIEVDFARYGRGAPAAPSAPRAHRAAGPDLMEEAAFQSLYGTVGASEPAAGRAPPADPGPWKGRDAWVPAPVAPPGPTPPAAVGRTTPAPPAAVRIPAPPEAPEAPELPEAPETSEPPEVEPDAILDLTDEIAPPALLAEPFPDFAVDVVEPLGSPLGSPAPEVLASLAGDEGHAAPEGFVPEAAASEEPEATPVTFAEAVRLLEGVADRDAIAQVVLRFARSRFRRAVLLTVQQGAAHGWAGLGERLTPAAVRQIRLPLGVPGLVETVATTRAHFLGPIPKTESNVRLLKQLGGGVPGNAFLVPILALGRVVNLFYADNGRGGVVDAADLGELLILATRISQGYEALVRRAA